MTTYMNYRNANDWIIIEDGFNTTYLGKCEAIMSLGNGYLGLRSTTEEKYPGERRNYFVAGTFNKFDENEVTELPNLADIVNLDLVVNGQDFSLEKGSVKAYSRQLNLKTGELKRVISWVSPLGDEFDLIFYRVVSLKDLHVVAQKVEIKPTNCNIVVTITSGIDARMTNSGSQHLSDGDKRLYEKKYMQLIQTSTETKIHFVHNTTLSFNMDGSSYPMDNHIFIDRRKVYSEYHGTVYKGKTLVVEKISNIYTSRDATCKNLDLSALQKLSLEALKESSEMGYDEIAAESAKEWKETIWDRTPILIQSEDAYDQLAVRFAQYHLRIMTPSHDNRMSVAAKGLSGEGYKGHTFWDTEIFVLPYYTFTNPEAARKLVEYRYLSLSGAHQKAKLNGFEGAQYPWESAWLDDGEVTPVWGAADIHTGLPTKIWSGFIEQHITADVAYGVWQYYMVTGDQKFMDEYGYELLLDTAKFWVSRLEYSTEDHLYHINQVVGPDEYKECIDDNAFTNYLAHWNIKMAIEYYGLLQSEKPDIYKRVRDKMDLDRVFQEWLQKVNLIYLPIPRESDQVIPQDKTYLTLQEIDLSKYKNQTHVGSIFRDYSLEQVNKIQVSKQADIMILFFLMENIFSLDVKKANWNYYEPKTLHDSSLSLSTHSILANDMGDYDMAYDLFKRQSRIDLGPNMKSSDEGIHAAAIGGTWQCVIFGFGGVRMLGGRLRIEPKLPKCWTNLQFMLNWHGQLLKVNIIKDKMMLINVTKEQGIEVWFHGKSYNVEKELEINI